MTVVEEKITLDREVFKTLASGTRVDILKSLDRRRKTLSELSKQFGMSVSTVKEHLDNLVAVGLIEQKDEGHKWKYYDLTKKGKNILHPEDKKVWILLGISALGIIVVGFDLLRNSLLGIGIFASMQTLSGGALTEGMKSAADRATETSPSFALPQLPYMHIFSFIIFAVLIAASLLYIRDRRKNIKI